MALSIRNAKTEKLARELAAESGGTITQAITQALESVLGGAGFDRAAAQRYCGSISGILP